MGHFTPHTPETKLKMSQNHADMKGKKNPFYGRKHTVLVAIASSRSN